MSATTTKVTTEHDGEYAILEQLIAARVAARPDNLFTTDADQTLLWEFYLEGIPEHNRQHYNCHCCRQFIQRYGGLVWIDGDGDTCPLVWPEGSVPPIFEKSIKSIKNLVSHAKVTGVFIDNLKTWGNPKTGEWTHLCGYPKKVDKVPSLWTCSQVEAEKLEDYKIMIQGLKDYPMTVVTEAVRVLKSDTLNRSEKARGIAEWFLKVHRALDGKKGRAWNNLLWQAVATAPPGFCHVRSTMISTLLDDIVAGMSFSVVKERWDKKMHPLQYQRPTAPVSDGQIEVAEKLVKDLGVASAFNRRYATIKDILKKVWEKPGEVVELKRATEPAGMFDHLRRLNNTKNVKPLALPGETMTWQKFMTTILPDAVKLEVRTPKNLGAFYGLVTAADPEAKPIIQWDGLEWIGDPEHTTWPRNPVSWYFYNGGSHAEHWNLPPFAWIECPVVFNAPHQWQRPDLFAHQGKEVFFALVGAKDMRGKGTGLFPEILKAELRGVRSVIEQYVKTAEVAGKDEGNANGLALSPNMTTYLRVGFGDGTTREFAIDRLD